MSRRFEQPRPDHGELRFSRRLAAMHMIGIAVLICIVTATAVWIAARHNELAKTSSEQMVRGGIASFRDKLDILVRDYSIWDEASVAVAEGDADWLYRNIGTGVVETAALDLIVIVDPRNDAVIGWKADSPAEGETALLPKETLDAVLGLLDGVNPASKRARTTFARIDGETWALAVTRIMPFEGPPQEAEDLDLPRQIHGMLVGERLLTALQENLLIDELRLADSPQPGMSAARLRNATGEPIAYVVWTPPAPGASILRQIALPLGVALLIAAAIGIVSSRYVVRSARRLERSLVAAKAADRAKTEFLSTVSHELRTPMNGIMGVVQLLEMSELDEEQQELVKVLAVSARTQISIIGDLIDYSQLESGARRVDRRVFAPRRVLDEIVKLIRPLAEEKGLALETELPGAAELLVDADERAFRQIMTNLVGNAVKFTSKGSVTVSAQVAIDDHRAFCAFSVVDTGRGISAQDRTRIFERFVRLEGPQASAVGGNGLGLAISKSLAEMMGGHIEIESELGRGSTFRFVVAFDRVATEDHVACAA